MERKIAGLVGTLAGLATLGSSGAHAAADATAMQQEPLSVTSYADLLQPIPNATEVLKAHNAKLMEQARSAPPELERVQWHRDGEHRHHHHHHHHHGYYGPGPEYYPPPVYYAPPPPPEYHHHHHNNVVIMPPGIGVQVYGD